ncbi:MAG: nodulation protein NfeD, partial [Gammaproteobacteria bacterium]
MIRIKQYGALVLKCMAVVCLVAGISLLIHAEQPGDKAYLLEISGPISPASRDYVHRGLSKAFEGNAALVILRMNTPGGLDSSMRDIIRDIIASPVPVVVYVSPSGARAASAGTYIIYAAHVAAMAPGTNLGAATPVQIGGLPDIKPPTMPTPSKQKEDKEKESDEEETSSKEDTAAPVTGDAMTKKIMNDSIAYIRSLAEMRGRNVEWAEKAVREAASLSAEQAMAEGVIDLIATDLDDLLTKINGLEVYVNGKPRTLNTDNLLTETLEPDWRNELLSVITDPNVAYLLMLLGIYGLFFEFVNPGYLVPGVTGAICMLLALYALQVLPVNYAGLLLILLGIMFMVAELFAPSFGALGIGGVVSFVIGSVILFDTEGSELRVAIPLIIAVSAVTAGFFLIANKMVFSAHRKPVVSGAEQMLG